MDAFVDRWWTSPDGLQLYARDYGGAGGPSKLPVICLHGLTRNSRDFEAVAPLLAGTGRRVLVPDVRGRGRSAWDPHPLNYHPGTYAHDVIALAERLGIAQAVFVGTSMGGLITMTLSAMRPDLVAAAALNDVGPELSPVGLKRIASYAGGGASITSWDDAIAYARRINETAFPHYGPADWDAFARRLFREDETGRPTLDYDPDISAPIRAAGPNALAPTLWPLFQAFALSRPTLLIRGERSDLLDAEVAARMRALGDMSYVEVSGVGHAPMLTEPEAQEALLAFLDRTP